MKFKPRLGMLPDEPRKLWPALADVPESFRDYLDVAAILRSGASLRHAPASWVTMPSAAIHDASGAHAPPAGRNDVRAKHRRHQPRLRSGQPAVETISVSTRADRGSANQPFKQ